MKPNSSRFRLLVLRTSATALFAATCQATYAATVVKANNTTNLNLTGSWSGGIVPGPADTAAWTSTVTTANSTLLGADLTWQGISVGSPGGLVTIGAGNTLTLGSAGIDMSAATRSLTIEAALALPPGGQSWNVTTGNTFTLTGILTRTTGATFNVDKSVNTGTVTSNLPLVNGIVGPWASVTSAGSSAGGLPDGDTYATVTAGNVVPYTGGTQLTTTGAWGGMPSGGTGTVNYDLTTPANPYATFGLGRFPNTVRYTGFGLARQPGNTNNADLFTLNGFMNAGGGTFTFGTAGNVANDRPYNVLVGPDLDLVLSPMTAGITFLNPIKNNTAGASAVTVSGRDIVTLSGVNAYTGATTVAGGTLLVNAAGAINTSTGITISGPLAKFIHASSVASTPPVTLTHGTLDGTGTVGAVTVGNGTGGVLTHGNGGTGALTLGSLTFNGVATVNATLTGGPAPLAVTGALATTTANGVVTLNVNSGPLANGLHNVISAGSFTGAASDFLVNVNSGLSSRQSAAAALNGSNLAIQVSGDSPKWTGAANGNWTTVVVPNPKNWKLIAANTATDFITGDNVLFDDTATGTTDVELSDDFISAGIVEFNNSTKSYTLSSSPGYGITDGSLVKNGTADLTINTLNTFVGGTTFNGGTLNLGNASALGSGALTIGSGSSKILDNTAGNPLSLTGLTLQNWNDDFTFTGTNDLDLGTGTVTLGGSGTDRTVAVSTGTLSVGEMKGAAHGFTKQGAGTLTVASSGAGNGGSAVAGTLNVAAGTLQINATGTGGTGSGDFSSTGLAGSGTIVNGATDERWLMVTNTGADTFNGTLANGDTGALGFNKLGAGSVTLGGTNSYSGATTLAAGTLIVAAPDALGLTSILRFTNGTTVDLATDTDGAHVAPIAFGTGSTITIVSNRATPGAGINHTLTTQTAANGVGGGTINVTNGANVTSGAGRITFTQLGLGAGSVQTTTLNPTTANVTIGAVAKENNNISQTLGLGGTSVDNHVTGVISNGTPLTGGNNVSVLKTGTSTWTLSGVNTYTGSTTVSEGTLILTTPSLVDASSVVIGATGVLTLSHGATDEVAALTINGVVKPNGVYSSATDPGFITGSGQIRVGPPAAGTYATWAAATGLTTGVNDAPGQDADLDGSLNGAEFILGGLPLSGSNNPKTYSLIEDGSVDVDSQKELILTIAVPVGTSAFPAGAPTSTATFEGYQIEVRGSTTLASFPVTVTPVNAVLTGLPPAPVQGGVTYEYRSFSLDGSNGTTGKGFLQVVVTQP